MHKHVGWGSVAFKRPALVGAESFLESIIHSPQGQCGCDPTTFHYMQLPKGSTTALPCWGLACSTSGGHVLNIFKMQKLSELRRIILCSPLGCENAVVTVSVVDFNQ